MASSIDALLDRALGGPPAEPVLPAAETLPVAPTRRQVLTTLRALEGEIRQCAEGRTGIVETRITVVGATGRAASVAVTGEFAGTAVGSCAARVIRTARFPRFSQDRFEIAFPYRL